MARRSHLFRCMALAIMLLASSEIVFCAQCSPESCIFSHNHHSSRTSSQSGDECLCCCGHLLIRSAVHIEPVTLVTLTAQPEPAHVTIERHAAVYHPPRAIAL